MFTIDDFVKAQSHGHVCENTTFNYSQPSVSKYTEDDAACRDLWRAKIALHLNDLRTSKSPLSVEGVKSLRESVEFLVFDVEAILDLANIEDYTQRDIDKEVLHYVTEHLSKQDGEVGPHYSFLRKVIRGLKLEYNVN